MWIKEAILKNFGKFSDKEITFSPGINLIYGENESGKTTLHTFLKGCIYGIRKMRGRASKNDTYSRYEPWENPAYYAGNIRFVCGDKVFRLERDFEKNHAQGTLVCETDGEKLSLEDGDLQTLLGEASEALFDNTVYISQMKSRTDEGLVAELKNYMANYQGGADGSLDIQGAIASLRAQRKEQEKAQKAREDKEHEARQNYQMKVAYLQEEITQDEREYADEKQKLAQAEEIDSTSPVDYETGSTKESDRVLHGTRLPNQDVRRFFTARNIRLAVEILSVCLITSLAVFYLRTLLTGVIAAVVCLVIVLLERFFFPSKRPSVAQEIDDSDKYIRWNLDRLEKEIKEKKIELANLQEEELNIEQQDHGAEYTEQQALAMAENKIEAIVTNRQKAMGMGLKNRVSEILSQITKGKYQQVQLDEDFAPGVHTKDRYVMLEQLSRGAMEQVYFALRMAAGELLCKEEPLPIILDDVFAMYDEERLEETLAWLAKQKRQVLLFTCHKREEALMQKLDIPYGIIRL